MLKNRAVQCYFLAEIVDLVYLCLNASNVQGVHRCTELTVASSIRG